MFDEWPESISDWLIETNQIVSEDIRESVAANPEVRVIFEKLATFFGEDTALRILAKLDDIVPCLDAVVAMSRDRFEEGECATALERTAHRICEKWSLNYSPSLKCLLIEEARAKEASVETIKLERIRDAFVEVWGTLDQPEPHKFRDTWLKGYDGKQFLVSLEKFDLPHAWYRLRNKTILMAVKSLKKELLQKRMELPLSSEHAEFAPQDQGKAKPSIDTGLLEALLLKYATPKERAVLEGNSLTRGALVERAQQLHISPATARVHKHKFLNRVRDLKQKGLLDLSDVSSHQ